MVRLSRLDNESLYDDVVYEPLRALLGVAATRTEKYFSCSMLEVVSPLEVAASGIFCLKSQSQQLFIHAGSELLLPGYEPGVGNSKPS